MSARRLIETLVSASAPCVEVYTKNGRSRAARLELGVASSQVRQEQGWAVRVGGETASFFAAGSGPLAGSRTTRWPALLGGSLQLPRVGSSPARTIPGIEAPLLGEGEAVSILDTARQELATECSAAQLLSAQLDDGFAEASIESSHDLAVEQRTRVATIRLRARLGDDEAEVVGADRHARRLAVKPLARRLADRLTIAANGEVVAAGKAEMLLAPEVGSALLEGLDRLWIGAQAWPRMQRLLDSRGQLGSRALTVIDDGGLEGGLFESSEDGEGVPTRRITLVERGAAKQPLLAWFESESGVPSGCSLRPSWRQPPQPGATHLFIAPDPKQPVSDLLSGVRRGYYFIDALGPATIDVERNRLSLAVCGFAVERGVPRRPIKRAWLTGSVSSFLGGIDAVGRDLRFRASNGCHGSPSLLVTGLGVEG